MQNVINLEKSIGGEAALSVPNDILVLYKGQHDLVCRKLFTCSSCHVLLCVCVRALCLCCVCWLCRVICVLFDM